MNHRVDRLKDQITAKMLLSASLVPFKKLQREHLS